MPPRRIAIIQGHPAAGGGHFCHALADAYAQGAADAGHEVRQVAVADLDFPLLRSKEEWETATAVPAAIRQPQETIGWADHLVILYPLWLGDMPAILKGFLEQALRPGFAVGAAAGPGGELGRKLLTGKSARIVVTMGMPAFLYRWYFGAHSLRSLKRSMLGLCGVGPIRDTLIGGVEAIGDARRQRWLRNLNGLGRRGC
ncbi:MAG TPA: NAD(P)H-dependent oxidoreductase [Stellaceae bacterium]